MSENRLIDVWTSTRETYIQMFSKNPQLIDRQIETLKSKKTDGAYDEFPTETQEYIDYLLTDLENIKVELQ